MINYIQDPTYPTNEMGDIVEAEFQRQMDDDVGGGGDKTSSGDDGDGEESNSSSAQVGVGGSKGEVSSQMMTEILEQEANKGFGKGSCHLRFSGIRPLRGGGVPPFSAKEKILLFFTLIFR